METPGPSPVASEVATQKRAQHVGQLERAVAKSWLSLTSS